MLELAAISAVFAVVLAWPVPLALASAAWPARHPARAVAVWQGVGLGGGLSLLGTELALAAALPAWIGMVGLVLFAGTVVWLFTVLIGSALRVRRGRQQHRGLLDLLAQRGGGGVPADVSVLAHHATAAYSVPGRHGRIVVSQGACDSLDTSALRAVIEHERTHLRQRHDVVVQPFVAWQQSFRFVPSTTIALRAVQELTEYLADDAARDRVGALAVDASLSALLPPSRARTRRRGRIGISAGCM